jgi:hypothetical protein
MISSGQRKNDAGHFDTLLYHEAGGLIGLREQSCSPYVAPCPDGFAPKDVVDGINPGAGRAANVLREGGRVCLIHAPASVYSKQDFWDGVSLEAFENIPACSIPEHEHPTRFLNLLTHGRIRAQWTSDGVTLKDDHGPGVLYLLPAGSRDLMSWSGPTSRIVLAIKPDFVAGVLDETAHLLNVEVRPTWTFEDQHSSYGL